MPTTAARRGSSQQSNRTAQPMRTLRFTASAHEHQEPIYQQQFTLGAGIQQSNPTNIDVPAYGFLANVVLYVQWSGGTTDGVLAADAPFSFFNTMWTQDVNGAYFQYPLDGFSVMEENVWGGYTFRQDPRNNGKYAAASASGSFLLRLPIQVTRHNAYGCLANQNAGATYKFGFTVNPITSFYSTNPGTHPTFTVSAFMETWTQPNATDIRGRPQAQLPPLHGSTQQWSFYTKTVGVGNNVTQFPRVGNTIRSIAIIARNGDGVRDDTVFPDPFSLNLDGRVLTQESQFLRKYKMGEALTTGATVDTGVFVFYFNNSILGHIGDESSDLWLPTLQSSRLELVGASATAGQLQIITNDIAQVEVDQAQRYVMESETGNLEHPDVVAA